MLGKSKDDMSFRRWSRTQRNSDDTIGDLARDVTNDSGGKRLKWTVYDWHAYLEDRNACDGAIDALYLAWDEWVFKCPSSLNKEAPFLFWLQQYDCEGSAEVFKEITSTLYYEDAELEYVGWRTSDLVEADWVAMIREADPEDDYLDEQRIQIDGLHQCWMRWVEECPALASKIRPNTRRSRGPQIEYVRYDDQQVYFAQNAVDAAIKIGVSICPRKRVSDMLTGSAHEIILLGSIPGGTELEKMLHARFASDRLRGEWFRASPLLVDYIKEKIDNAFVLTGEMTKFDGIVTSLVVDGYDVEPETISIEDGTREDGHPDVCHHCGGYTGQSSLRFSTSRGWSLCVCIDRHACRKRISDRLNAKSKPENLTDIEALVVL